MDQILTGLITQNNESGDLEVIPSDFVVTLLRDPIGSRVIEVIVAYCTYEVFTVMWEVYLMPQLVKFAIHPISNFVVAKCVQRMNEDTYSKFMDAMHDAWIKVIKSGRGGILLSALRHSLRMPSQQDKAMSVR
jgi:nucleolar protein 9